MSKIEITDELLQALGINDPDNYNKQGLLNVVTKKLGGRSPEEAIKQYEAKVEKKQTAVNADVAELDEDAVIELLEKLGYKGSVDKPLVDLQIALSKRLNKESLTVDEAEALEPEEKERKLADTLPLEIDFHSSTCTAEPRGISAGLRDAALVLEKAGYKVKTGRNFNRKPTQILLIPELHLRLEGGGLPAAYQISKEA